ncbi:MAG: ATP-binding cassette domain-containing protein [Deltaproteobacteria bacterium]|jgi:putative ABC transport system ATP-binding protein|nr:ATP-binding cassette domain-containing protein [Deltaproteobacteria bacterium]
MLKASGLIKYFNRGTINEVKALNGLDLNVAPGEYICIIGSNGSGKSTLMGCISGTSPPDYGRTVLDQQDITYWPEHKRAGLIGRVFQDPLAGTCASMTIEENMALALRRGQRRGFRRGVGNQERAKFREALARLELGLENRLTDPVGLLSGGQRQSLTLLMATLIKPKLLLLDEHTAALDPKTAGLIMELTCSLVDRNQLTTLMITHNMQQAISFGHRLIMMHQGRIILDFNQTDKARLTVRDLIQQFHSAAPDLSGLLSDRLVLG